MLQFKAAALGLALVACAGVARTTLAAEAMMSDTDHKMMTSCMAMSSDAMMKDADCTGMMKKMNMSGDDMMKMKSCMAMSNDAMMKDAGCTAMEKAHPSMSKPAQMNK